MARIYLSPSFYFSWIILLIIMPHISSYNLYQIKKPSKSKINENEMQWLKTWELWYSRKHKKRVDDGNFRYVVWLIIYLSLYHHYHHPYHLFHR